MNKNKVPFENIRTRWERHLSHFSPAPSDINSGIEEVLTFLSSPATSSQNEHKKAQRRITSTLSSSYGIYLIGVSEERFISQPSQHDIIDVPLLPRHEYSAPKHKMCYGRLYWFSSLGVFPFFFLPLFPLITLYCYHYNVRLFFSASSSSPETHLMTNQIISLHASKLLVDNNQLGEKFCRWKLFLLYNFKSENILSNPTTLSVSTTSERFTFLTFPLRGPFAYLIRIIINFIPSRHTASATSRKLWIRPN